MSPLRSIFVVSIALAAPASAAEPPGHAPQWRLRHQVLLMPRRPPADYQPVSVVSLIERGHEMIRLNLDPTAPTARGWCAYDTAQRRIIPVAADFADPATQPGAARSTPPAGIAPAVYDRWMMFDHWRGFFVQSGREDLLKIGSLAGGFACFARNGTSPDAPARVFLDRSDSEPLELGALAQFESRTLSAVHHLRLLRSGDVIVVASGDAGTVLQHYENPMLPAICAQWNALMDHAHREQPVCRARYIGSLYALSEYADRGFDPILIASDGKAYFGTMPHHPSEGGPIFCFDPARNALSLIGDIDRLAGVRAAGAVPSMVHASAGEMNRRVYFVGQDPFYGRWGFPLEKGATRPVYRGSPIVEYDLAAGRARGLGIPIAGDNALFRIVCDAPRKRLYVRRGYARDYYGPLMWYALELDAAGNIAGAPRALPLDYHPSDILIAADGTLWCVVPDRQAYEIMQQKRAQRQKTDDIAPRCDVFRIAPDLRAAQKVATVEGEWDIQWAPWQNGLPAAVGAGERQIYRLDMNTGALSALCRASPPFRPHAAPMALRDGALVALAWVQPRIRAGRTTGLYTLDLRSGQVRFHGVVVDESGRRVKDLTQLAVLKDGRIFAAGTVYGLATDAHYMPRYRDSEPYRLDSACLLIESIPPGVPAEKPAP